MRWGARAPLATPPVSAPDLYHLRAFICKYIYYIDYLTYFIINIINIISI